MMDDLREVLTSPRSFFEREVAEPSVRGPVAILATIAVVGTATGVVTTLALADGYGEQARGLLVAAQVFAAVFGLVGPFVVWLLYAAAFFLVSALFGGEGTFRQVALLSAWGFVPRVLASLVEFAARVVAVQQTPVPDLTAPEEAQAFTNELMAHPASLAASAIGIGLLLWSGAIWVAALQEARELDRREAIITVAIPVAVALLFRLVGLLGVLG